MKLEEKDEVVGLEVLPAEGEILLLTNTGKAKRVDQKDFPAQGRYGKGVIAWELPGKEKLVGAVSGKPNHMATIHLSKGAPKSTRLDAVAVRKRAASKGDHLVELKPGEETVSVNVAWTVEKFVSEKKEETAKKPAKAKAPAKAKKPAAKASSKGKSPAKKKK
jgi:DNA gyrase/topoisomerase IV subunit A